MEASPRPERLVDRNAVDIINAMQPLDWRRIHEKRNGIGQEPMSVSVVDPLEGHEYRLMTDRKYLNLPEITRPSQIPTHLFRDWRNGGYSVIPFLELQAAADDHYIYRLYGNFDQRNSYQLGDGLKLRYQALTIANDGQRDLNAEVVRMVYGNEESDFKSLLERLLATDLR
jgi:hypothetical protein